MDPLSPSFPAQVSCGEIFLSHGLGLAQHQGPPEPQVQHSSQRWPVPRASSSGVPLPQGDVFLGCNGMCSQCLPPQERHRGLGRAGNKGQTHQSWGLASPGPSTPRKAQEGSQPLTHQTGRCTGFGSCSAGRSS